MVMQVGVLPEQVDAVWQVVCIFKYGFVVGESGMVPEKNKGWYGR